MHLNAVDCWSVRVCASYIIFLFTDVDWCCFPGVPTVLPSFSSCMCTLLLHSALSLLCISVFCFCVVEAFACYQGHVSVPIFFK